MPPQTSTRRRTFRALLICVGIAVLGVSVAVCWVNVDRRHHCVSGRGVSASRPDAAAQVVLRSMVDGDSAGLVGCFVDDPERLSQMLTAAGVDPVGAEVRLEEQLGSASMVVVSSGSAHADVVLRVKHSTFRPWWALWPKEYYSAHQVVLA